MIIRADFDPSEREKIQYARLALNACPTMASSATGTASVHEYAATRRYGSL